MAVISITITPSADQTIPGIPNTIAIETNEPSTIFYTLDGTTPNVYSSVYVAPISIPAARLKVILNVFATNGIDSSAIITTEYIGNISTMQTMAGDRVPHAAVTNLNNNSANNSLFPFGVGGPNPTFNYLNAGDAGTTVYNQSLPATSVGFDGSGNPDGYSNQSASSFAFKEIYDTTNFVGVVFPGVGNLPDSNSTVIPPASPPIGQAVKPTVELPGVGSLPGNTEIISSRVPLEFSQEISSTSDKLFNPRAMVIYQDTTTADPTNPTIINRQFFSLENQEIVRDGALLYSNSLDNPTVMGSYIKSFYNSRTNMLTSYFYDNAYQKWIISSAPYESTNRGANNLQFMLTSRPGPDSVNEINGAGFIYQWIPFARRVLM